MNWQNMIRELMASGMTQEKIGEELGGRPQSWVRDVAKGRYSDLKWHDGQALLALHMKMCKPAQSDSAASPP